MSRNRIIIVDDEKDMRDFLEIMLRKEGYDVHGAASGEAALEYCKSNRFDLVITDLKMPGLSGVEFLKALKELDPDALVIMVTAYASVDTAIEAMKSGAYDYFTKPFKIEEIKLHIRNALKSRNLERENRLLKKDLKTKFGFNNLFGASPRMVELYGMILNVARTRTNVLISGESGTGKELVARAIHYESERKDAPFIAVNCGAIPENLLESELFGHQRGAFTGAVVSKEGLAEQADGGTLFLDEITELPLHLQVKLLRFIQEKKVRRVGGTTDIPVDIRFISASNRDIESEVKSGRFREDLFYRLNVVRLALPPLRERKEDIPLLARHFMEKFSRELGKDITRVSEEAIRVLVDHDFPGNVRELENIMERAVALEETGVITGQSLPPGIAGKAETEPFVVEAHFAAAANGAERISIPAAGVDLEKTVEDFERAMLVDALRKTGGVKKKAAELLGLTFRSMRYKLSKYDIPDE